MLRIFANPFGVTRQKATAEKQGRFLWRQTYPPERNPHQQHLQPLNRETSEEKSCPFTSLSIRRTRAQGGAIQAQSDGLDPRELTKFRIFVKTSKSKCRMPGTSIFSVLFEDYATVA